MAKISKEEQWRREGMAYALKIAKEKGIDGLEDEIRFRGISKISIAITREDAEAQLRECSNRILDTVLVMASHTLRDEFDFGTARLSRYKARFNEKSECLAENKVTWSDILNSLRDEVGIPYEIRGLQNEEKV